MKPDELSPETEAELTRAFEGLAAETPADSGSRPTANHLYWRARVLDRLAARAEEDEAAVRPARWGALAALLLALAGLWGGVASMEVAVPAFVLVTVLFPPALLGLGWWMWREEL